MQLSYDAQLVVLGAGLALAGGVIGYLVKAWLDRREYERRRKQEQESKILEENLIRGASLEEIREIADRQFYGGLMADGWKPPIILIKRFEVLVNRAYRRSFVLIIIAVAIICLAIGFIIGKILY